VCAALLAGESVYVVGPASSSSMLTDLSHQYITPQHGTAGYQRGTAASQRPASSSQHGTPGMMYGTQHGSVGIDGYFADESQQMTGQNLLPGTAELLRFSTCLLT